MCYSQVSKNSPLLLHGLLFSREFLLVCKILESEMRIKALQVLRVLKNDMICVTMFMLKFNLEWFSEK